MTATHSRLFVLSILLVVGTAPATADEPQPPAELRQVPTNAASKPPRPKSSSGTTLWKSEGDGVRLRLVDPSSSFRTQRQRSGRVRLAQLDQGSDDLSDLLQDLETSGPSDRTTDGLLDQARELLQEPQPTDDLLPLQDGPARGDTDSMRSRLREELDRLMPSDEPAAAEALPSGDATSPRDTDVPPAPPQDAEVETPPTTLDDLVDPVPQPIYRRRPTNDNQPYTLSGILNDDDQTDCHCEAEFCRRMWECAGGRCQSPWDRMTREWHRNRAILWNGNCGSKPCNPMDGFSCHGTGCQTCNGSGVGPYGGAGPYPYGGAGPHYTEHVPGAPQLTGPAATLPIAEPNTLPPSAAPVELMPPATPRQATRPSDALPVTP